jgi:hypothetical protein
MLLESIQIGKEYKQENAFLCLKLLKKKIKQIKITIVPLLVGFANITQIVLLNLSSAYHQKRKMLLGLGNEVSEANKSK